jgi:cobyric acid synthase CobQ/L-threonine-O-3-phosphate decarboxylase
MLERYGHGGDLHTAEEAFGRPRDSFLDFSSNMNPFGPPEGVRRVLARYADLIMRYPDPGVRTLMAKLARRYDIPEASVVTGNGAAELIDLLLRVLQPARTALARPSFSEYEEAVHKSGGTVVDIPLRPECGFVLQWADIEPTLAEADVYFLGHPNNPTGRLLPTQLVSRLLDAGKIVVLDEAFIDFAEEEDANTFIRAAALDERLFVIRSMTKFYAVPGIRLGFLAAHPEWAKRVKALQVTWSVNSLAQEIGCEVLDDEPYATRTKAWVQTERSWLTDRLSSLGIIVFPSDTNFLLLRLPSGISVKHVQPAMGRRGVLIRDASLFPGLDEAYARVAVRTRPENEALAAALEETLGELNASNTPGAGTANVNGQHTRPTMQSDPKNAVDTNTPQTQHPAVAPKTEPSKAVGRTLMLQGTSSDVGKSLLTAALCRMLTQDGLRVAPFKSQNMSLNSYVTPDGKEIGRAQGMQADACGIPATTDMNPILLKPSREMASQVVVHGKPLADMDARSYREQWLPQAEGIVRASLERLRAQADVVVIEGAGSPAEINLKNRDIVNMRLAGWADAPVVLVADIDRGGVFASIVGTLDILTEAERERIRGFIINKFRGDVTLLKPGLDWLERRTGKPVLGVVPFLPNVGLEDEDSASLAAKLAKQAGNAPPQTDQLDIAVIKLPYISNFTDFDPLPEEPDVALRFVTSAGQLGNPDIVLLPGSKNTVHDLRWLKETGLADRLIEHASTGGFLTGICAGYQMLGLRLLDPERIESEFGDEDGLGLFPTETQFTRDKKTEQVTGFAGAWQDAHNDIAIEGYEIHMGRTRFLEPVRHPFQLRVARTEDYTYHPDGAVSANGRIWGTYVHGILHNDELRRSWLNAVRQQKGWAPLPVTLHFRERREAAFNRLADHVRRHLDMGKLYEMIGISNERN